MPSLVSFLGAERLARRTGARLVFEVRDICPLTLVELGGTSPRHPFIRLLQRIEDRAYRVSDRVVANLPSPTATWWRAAWTRQSSPGSPTASRPRRWWSRRLPRPATALSSAMPARWGWRMRSRYWRRPSSDSETMPISASSWSAADARNPPWSAAPSACPTSSFAPRCPKADVPCVLGKFDACFIGLAKSSVFRFGVSPNKLFDYLATARPVIYAIDSGEYRPVADAGAGIEVPPGDPEALAAAILKLKALPPDERRAMGARGRRLVEDVHEYGAIARRLEGVLLSERSCRAPA